MGNCRFYYSNLITSSTMIEVTSQRSGFVTAPYKEGQGYGGLRTYGAFTGSQDLEYVVEIDSTASGNEVAQAKYQWRDSDSAWDATGVLTTTATAALNNGISISFTTATGSDFYLGDRFYFKGMNLFKPGNLIDGDRNTRWRAAVNASTGKINVNLGSAQEVKTIILYDHNFASNSTITITGADSTNFSTGFSTKATWNAGKIVHNLATASTWQYWRIDITASAAASTLLELGELYIGGYLQPTDNFSVDGAQPVEIITDTQMNRDGVRKDIFRAQKKRFDLSFPHLRSTDKDNLETMVSALGDSTTQKYKPVFFNIDSTLPNETWLVKVDGNISKTAHKARYSVDLTLEEVVKSA